MQEMEDETDEDPRFGQSNVDEVAIEPRGESNITTHFSVGFRFIRFRRWRLPQSSRSFRDPRATTATGGTIR